MNEAPWGMLISSSYVFGNKQYLGYCAAELGHFLPKRAKVMFVPFAYPQHVEYTALAAEALGRFGATVTGAHTVDPNTTDIAGRFDVVFCGGGNTFLLLKELYDRGFVEAIPKAIKAGSKYMGSSAGANVACPTIGTTNDMPIVEPKSLRALGLVPFNVNPHYFERAHDFEHVGETRRDRIAEFLAHNAVPVVALFEGAILMVSPTEVVVRGRRGGIVFRPSGKNQVVKEMLVDPGDVLSRTLERS